MRPFFPLDFNTFSSPINHFRPMAKAKANDRSSSSAGSTSGSTSRFSLFAAFAAFANRFQGGGKKKAFLLPDGS